MIEFFRKAYEIAKPMLPNPFDENEWFTIVITLIVFFTFYFLQKRKPIFLKTEVVAILLFNLFLTTVGDYTFAMKPYDFYDTVDHDSGEVMDILLHTIVYPVTVLIFMHYYAKLLPNKFLFILLAASLLFVFEWVSVEFFHLFTYKTWKISYSFYFYLIVMALNIMYYHKFHNYVHNLMKVKKSSHLK